MDTLFPEQLIPSAEKKENETIYIFLTTKKLPKSKSTPF